MSVFPPRLLPSAQFLSGMSVKYVPPFFTFAVVLRRYRMQVIMFFTKHASTWQAKLLANLFPSLVGFVFISVYVDPHVPKYRSPKNGHYHTLPHLLSVNKFMSVRKTLATPSVNLRKHGYEKHTYVETRREGTDVAVMHKYLRANLARRGSESSLFLLRC